MCPALFHATPLTPPQRHRPDRRRKADAAAGAAPVAAPCSGPSDSRATTIPAACYGLFDDVRSTLTYVRVPYDADLAARKIRAAGLPEILAARLTLGI